MFHPLTSPPPRDPRIQHTKMVRPGSFWGEVWLLGEPVFLWMHFVEGQGKSLPCERKDTQPLAMCIHCTARQSRDCRGYYPCWVLGHFQGGKVADKVVGILELRDTRYPEVEEWAGGSYRGLKITMAGCESRSAKIAFLEHRAPDGMPADFDVLASLARMWRLTSVVASAPAADTIRLQARPS